jgi:hypothetical protein
MPTRLNPPTKQSELNLALNSEFSDIFFINVITMQCMLRYSHRDTFSFTDIFIIKRAFKLYPLNLYSQRKLLFIFTKCVLVRGSNLRIIVRYKLACAYINYFLLLLVFGWLSLSLTFFQWTQQTLTKWSVVCDSDNLFRVRGEKLSIFILFEIYVIKRLFKFLSFNCVLCLHWFTSTFKFITLLRKV